MGHASSDSGWEGHVPQTGGKCPTSLKRVLSETWEAWRAWIVDQERLLREDGFPDARRLAARLRRTLGLRASAPPGDVVTAVCEAFHFNRSVDHNEAPGAGAVSVRVDSGLYDKQASLRVAIGAGPMVRRHSVWAHELGHVFLAVLLESALEIGVLTRDQVDALEEERFSWDFSLGLCCPDKVVASWNRGYVQALLSADERRLVDVIESPALRAFTYYHLRALACAHRISMRATLVALDRHPLLAQVACGIGVFRVARNRHTGLDRGLRMWQSARPPWGYVVTNRRVRRQGFRAAHEVYAKAEPGGIAVYRERLSVRRRTMGGPTKWTDYELTVDCAYTAVDVRDESRFLLAIWHWPNPEA